MTRRSQRKSGKRSKRRSLRRSRSNKSKRKGSYKISKYTQKKLDEIKNSRRSSVNKIQAMSDLLNKMEDRHYKK